MQLNQASLSRILCDNADNIDRVPMDAFILQDKSEFTSCSDIPRVDLTMWQECSMLTCLVGNGERGGVKEEGD